MVVKKSKKRGSKKSKRRGKKTSTRKKTKNSTRKLLKKARAKTTGWELTAKKGDVEISIKRS